MRKLSVGDLATFKVHPEHTDESMSCYQDCIVCIVEVIQEEFLYWDYYAVFPDNKIFEVHDEELKPIFSN